MSDKLCLNLGCGTESRKDFINIDIQELPGVDKVLDIRDLSEFKDESVDFIVAQRVLAYIPRKDTIPTLLEWKRVLKKGSPLEVRTLDISSMTKAIYLNNISKEIGLHHEMVISLLYGKQINEHDIRYNGFTSEFLQGVLRGIGFEVVNLVIEEFEMIITGLKV